MPFQSLIRALILLYAARRARLLPVRRVRQQIFEQLTPLRAMTVAIEFGVPIDVLDEMTQAIVVVFRVIERIEKPAEHLWDDVFAAVEERRQHLFGRTRIGQRHRRTETQGAPPFTRLETLRGALSCSQVRLMFQRARTWGGPDETTNQPGVARDNRQIPTS